MTKNVKGDIGKPSAGGPCGSSGYQGWKASQGGKLGDISKLRPSPGGSGAGKLNPGPKK